MAASNTRSATPSRTRPSSTSKLKTTMAITGLVVAMALLAWNAGLLQFWDSTPPAELAALQIEAAKSPAQRDADAKARQAQLDMTRELAKKTGTVTGSP